LDLAIIGLPQSGKTALFEAIVGGHGRDDGRAEHIAVVKLPDERLERLAALVQSKRVVPAELRLHDLPAPFQHAPGSADLGGVALSPEHAATLAGADLLIHVVRAFHRDDVPHPQGSVDSQRDIESLDLELAYHDLGIIERRRERLEPTVRSARPGEREAGERELLLLDRLKEHLGQDLPLRNHPFTPSDIKQVSGYGFLSIKPVLLVINIDEADIPKAAAIESDLHAPNDGGKASLAAVCAKLEAELAQLSPEEAEQFRQELGASSPAVPRLLGLVADLLGLVTFYTPVGTECRAWPVPAGTTALAAAGRIHSDMERGFIRAEAIAWEELMAIGSFAEAKKRGRLRSEGKGYVIQDGDVLHILFHV
jgi:GTP-binding protein YchF